QAVLASSAFPHMTSPIRVGVGEIEEDLVDGACGIPVPTLPGITRFRPDPLIVLSSRPHPKHLPRFEQWLWPMFARTFLRHMPVGLRRSAAAMTRAMATASARPSGVQHILSV